MDSGMFVIFLYDLARLIVLHMFKMILFVAVDSTS
jgi:hypothetical protein